MEQKTFKTRAECFQNVVIFFGNIPWNKRKNVGIKIEQIFLPIQGHEPGEFQKTGIPIPNVESEFTTRWTLEEITATLKKVTSGQVIWQTVKTIEEYTGERDY